MAPRKPAAKKTVAKKPAQKSESASVKPPESKFDTDRNSQAIVAKDGRAGTSKKPKIHAKSVSLIVSVGTYDRDRNIEAFIEEILKQIGQVPYGEEGTHATVTGSYYILDGKVCLPDDYDKRAQNFKKGAVPPSWAGGPNPHQRGNQSIQQTLEHDAKTLTSDEYDQKYRLGKYKPKDEVKASSGKIITPEMQQAHLEQLRKEREQKEAEKKTNELEEFDWDEDDVYDDDKLGAVADESASEFTEKLKASPKKRVVRKSSNGATKKNAPTKRVVRKVKK